MSELNKLLDCYAPPPAPAGLAERAAAAAATRPQMRAADLRKRDRRGGWRRPLLIGATGLGIAFTSAVAATVASDGRIRIPVVQQVVAAAAPVLNLDPPGERPARKAKTPAKAPQAAPAAAVQAEAQAPQGASPSDPRELRRQRAAASLTAIKRQVEARRAAGLPTPRADRIERQAQRIVERRRAAGRPAPPVEQVEAVLAMRELRRMRQQRGGALAGTITDEQVARFAERLPAQRRERFLALSPQMQRRIIVRVLDRRRALQAGGAADGSVPPPAEQP